MEAGQNNKTDVKIPVRDLKIGMFVSGLDRDWLDTPFLMQGFFVRSQEDISKVSEYCKHVYVLGSGKMNFAGVVDFESGILIGRKPEKYPIQSNVSEEHVHARSISKKVRKYVHSMLKEVRLGGELDTQTAKSLVEESVSSVIRHPDAVAFITKLRGQDDYTVEHCLNVCMLAIVFGRKLGLRKTQLVNIGLCGLLHDVGKMKIPNDILNKPGRLTPEEYDLMKLHTVHGKEYLESRKGVYQGAVEAAGSHHERPDGLGYPAGIPNDELSIFTRIISIVDAYDAITGDRVYAKGRPSTEALRIIYEHRGTQFDEQFALAFIQTIGIYPPGSVVQLVNGKVAVVIDGSSGLRHLPKILIVRDENQQPCEEMYLDLSSSVDSKLDKGFLIKYPLVDGCYGIYLKDYYERGVLENLDSLIGNK